MRLLALLVAALTIISGAIAVDVQKSVIITYPQNTPDSVLDQAKKAIEDAGGIITHNYQFIKCASQPSFLLHVPRTLGLRPTVSTIWLTMV